MTTQSLDRFVLGCAQLGGLFRAISEDEATQTLSAAWEAGVRHFDTAPHYGAGLSERRVGRFLQQFDRSEFTLSTKVGRLLVPTADDVDGVDSFFGGDRNVRVLDFSGAGIIASLEQSLERLGLDRVDTVYVHDPDNHVDQTVAEAIPALVELRQNGTVSRVGAGMNHAAPLTRIVLESDVDQIMLAGRYTLLDRDAETELLPACVEQDVDVVAAGVFNSGLLADPRPGATFDYGDAPSALIERASELQHLCQVLGVSLRAAALAFPLRHPAVKAVAVGCRGEKQVSDNVATFLAGVPQELWRHLDAAYSTTRGYRPYV